MKADIDLKAPEIMEYRSTQRGFSTQNNHVPPILSVRSQAFHAVTVHLPRGGRGPPAQYRRSSRRQPASNTRRHDTGKGEAAASLAPALAVGGHEPVPGTIAQQIQLAAHAADNRRQRCVREHSAAPQLGPLPPPHPRRHLFPRNDPRAGSAPPASPQPRVVSAAGPRVAAGHTHTGHTHTGAGKGRRTGAGTPRPNLQPARAPGGLRAPSPRPTPASPRAPGPRRRLHNPPPFLLLLLFPPPRSGDGAQAAGPGRG